MFLPKNNSDRLVIDQTKMSHLFAVRKHFNDTAGYNYAKDNYAGAMKCKEVVKAIDKVIEMIQDINSK